MSKPVLYNYWRSSCSWRLRAALNYKNIDYEYRSIHIAPGKDEQRTEKFLAINPNGQIPALVVEENGKQCVLTQSMAIIRYLEDLYPDAPKLLPSDRMARYHVEDIVDKIVSGIQPLQNLPVLHKFNTIEQGSGVKWAKSVIETGFKALEIKLRETSGKFCVGDQLTVADLCLVPQVYNARRYGVAMDAFPKIASLAESLSEHPAIASSHPDKMPDAGA